MFAFLHSLYENKSSLVHQNYCLKELTFSGIPVFFVQLPRDIRDHGTTDECAKECPRDVSPGITGRSRCVIHFLRSYSRFQFTIEITTFHFFCVSQNTQNLEKFSLCRTVCVGFRRHCHCHCFPHTFIDHQ